MLKTILPFLPAVNAVLIFTSGIFILRGVAAIRRGDRETHERHMLTATTLASIFLVIYSVRLSLGGLTTMRGPQWLRMFYYGLLITHLVTAIVSTPIVLTTLYLALRRRFDRHRKWARWAYPMWVYVAFTGVLVFVLLHLPGLD